MDPTDTAIPAPPTAAPRQPKKKRDPDQVYFANLPDDKIGDAIWERKREYERFVKQSGLFALYRKMHWRYYGHEENTAFSTHEVGIDGKQGELHRLKVNHLRSIMTSWINMVQSQRPAVVPVAINDDYESELEVKRGRAVLDHERGPSGAGIECREAECREFAGLYGHAGLLQLWNEALGDVVLPDAASAGLEAPQDPEHDLEQSDREGRLQAFALSPLDFFFDPRRKDAHYPWVICRIWACREDLIARFPKFEEQILAVKTQPEADGTDGIDFQFQFTASAGASPINAKDEIPVYVFLHDKTEGVQNGKQVMMLDSQTVLKSGPLGYKTKPFIRLAAANIDRTPFGFSPAWDLLAPQEAHDSLSTIALTNARTFGLGTMTAEKSADVERDQLAEGLVLLEYTPGMQPPKPLEMPHTGQEVFSFRQAIGGEMGTQIGVNSVVRGDPEASLKSGSALALVQAQGVQFSSGFQSNDTRFIESHSLVTIEACQTFMTEERTYEIVGSHVASLTLPFNGSKLKRITKVRVQLVNPMSKTLAGRVQMADTLAERYSNVFSPGDYMRVQETGNLDHITKGPEQKAANIERENELLSQGFGPVPKVPSGQMGPDGQPQMVDQKEPGKRYVIALLTDDHRAHVRKHTEIVDNPAIRDSDDPLAVQIIKATLDHIDEHERQLTIMTLQRPGLLELTNQQPLQSALPPQAGPGAPGASPPHGGSPTPPKPGGPPGPQNNAPAGQVLQPTPAGGNQLPRMPNMPVNPSTNSRVEAPGPH